MVVHMHMHREIENLKKQVLDLGGQVEGNVQQAVHALHVRDVKLAEKIIDSDEAVDASEVLLEEECLKILALYQPVAIDLRFLIAVLKINNDLERIGDLAVNIAERALFLSSRDPVDIPFDFIGMADKTKAMLRKSLESLVSMDAKLASNVCGLDDEVDAINRQMYEQVQEGILKNPGQIGSYIHCLSTSRHLERIADHATNIAEDVIYMVAGQIVRHKAEDFRP